MPVIYILSSVWVTLSIFSQLSIMKYVRIYILYHIIIIESEVWNITHCLGLGYETMVCAVCISIFLERRDGWLKKAQKLNPIWVHGRGHYKKTLDRIDRHGLPSAGSNWDPPFRRESLESLTWNSGTKCKCSTFVVEVLRDLTHPYNRD